LGDASYVLQYLTLKHTKIASDRASAARQKSKLRVANHIKQKTLEDSANITFYLVVWG
jgi:hypothetical protein